MESSSFRAQRLESLGTLASGIAHDFEQHLTPILLVVQLLPLKLPDVDPSIQTKLDILERSAQRGLIWSSKILSFARGVEGQTLPPAGASPDAGSQQSGAPDPAPLY